MHHPDSAAEAGDTAAVSPPGSNHTVPAWTLGRASVRLGLSCALGLLAATLYPAHAQWVVRALVGWDCGAATMISLSWLIIARASPAQTRRRAAANDPGRFAVWGTAIGASLFSLFAATVVLRRTHSLQRAEADLWTGLAIAAIVLSWGLTHTAYTLRYAHLYYRHSRGEHRGPLGGLKFPEDSPEPCDMDFAYFAFTLGMCFQVSDVSITRWQIRREVLLHAMLSFVYNTTLLALALNLVSGLLQ